MDSFRPSWDDYFMAIARIVATRSTCSRLHAGAVLAKNRRILSTGYNGAPPGLPRCDGEAGHLMEEGHCIRTVHAEENTILQAAAIGKASFNASQLVENASTLIEAIQKAKPASAKGTYFATLTLTSTMGPGVKIQTA